MQAFIKGKKIEYDVVGKGEAVLFVHGWSGNRVSLSALANLLKDSYSCYLLDLPGRGGSDNPDSDWGVQEYAGVVSDFITKVIKTKSIKYIGTSFGGVLGVYIASSGSLISKLVLCAPSYRREKEYGDGNVEKSQSHVLSSLRKLLKRIQPIRKLYYKIFFPHSEFLKLAHLESNFLKVISTDFTSVLGDIVAKTLIIYGEDDIETPIYQAHILNDGIKGSELRIYNSYGHELPVYYPEVIVDDIKLFLK